MSDRTRSGDGRTLLGILMLVSVPAVGEPTPVADETLLLFLADMIEVEGELTDALDMQDVALTRNLESADESTESVLDEEPAAQ